MSSKNILKLIILSAIWGGSFIFMRMISPRLGPILTASMRTLLAGICLLILFKVTHYKINWKRDYKQFLVIGVVNSSIPFYMFAYAALHIPASLSAIMNSMSPMFGAILSAVFLLEPLSIRKSIGLILGSLGVGIISSLSVTGAGHEYYLAIGACLLAALCYGISSIYIKLRASHIEAKSIAAGSQLFAGLALLPFAFIKPYPVVLDVEIIAYVLLFAIFCNAIAYLLYYDLIKHVGPTKALTVTFLVPIFSILWGYTLLNEGISTSTVIGGLIILCGTYLVVTTSHNKELKKRHIS